LFRVTLETTARVDAGEDIEERQAFVETYLLTFSFFLVFHWPGQGAGHVLEFFLDDAVFVSDEIVCACACFLILVVVSSMSLSALSSDCDAAMFSLSISGSERVV
jgi:hypothetical protein